MPRSVGFKSRTERERELSVVNWPRGADASPVGVDACGAKPLEGWCSWHLAIQRRIAEITHWGQPRHDCDAGVEIYWRQLAARLRCGRRNERSIEVALPGFEMVVGARAALGRRKAGKCGVRQAIAERVMAERFLGLAATRSETRFGGRATAGRAAESRGTELRAVRRVEESFATAWEGSCATSCATPGRASESAAASSDEMRAAEASPAARKLGRSSKSSGRELPAGAASGSLRARSHWARRACTSASTHSSKISLSSLRRLATVFKRLRWKDSMEASDEVKRYSRGRSMAFSRDAEPCFASPLELGIGFIDITRVITSYSTTVAVPVRGAPAGLAVRTNAEMGDRDRRFTVKGCERSATQVRFRREAAIGGLRFSNDAQASFSWRLPARPVPPKANSGRNGRMRLHLRACTSGTKRTRAWRS
jgi:hypothetical protein